MAFVALNGENYFSLTWRDIEERADALCRKIISEYSPDTIVGILRGGTIIANFVSDFLDLKEVYVIGCRSYQNTNRSEKVKIYHGLTLNKLTGRKVLLVDDVSDTGNTLDTATRYILRPKEPRTVKTATIHIKSRTKFVPDFYVEKADAWIIYPWERHESARLILPRIRRGLAEEDVFSELRKVLRSDEESLRRVLSQTAQQMG